MTPRVAEVFLFLLFFVSGDSGPDPGSSRLFAVIHGCSSATKPSGRKQQAGMMAQFRRVSPNSILPRNFAPVSRAHALPLPPRCVYHCHISDLLSQLTAICWPPVSPSVPHSPPSFFPTSAFAAPESRGGFPTSLVNPSNSRGLILGPIWDSTKNNYYWWTLVTPRFLFFCFCDFSCLGTQRCGIYSAVSASQCFLRPVMIRRNHEC